MKRAFIGVDFQVDFCEGGNLAVEGGAGAAARTAEYLYTHEDEYDLIILTRDWHIQPGRHFAAPDAAPDFQASFPVHCVAGTPGANFHPNLGDLDMDPKVTIISKGQEAASFSGFDGTTSLGVPLATFLRAYGIVEVEAGGIATEFCDKATMLDSVKFGFRTTLFTDLVAGINPEASEAALQEMAAAGVRIRSTRG